jgi:2-C-methyl-D-erythritol 2,4-cyclodiphosphate synthase
MSMRIGFGYDVHRFVPDRPLILGGVEIPHDHGLAGHSDADALLHAIADALLGAVALGDIGMHFPDTDPTWKGADSRELLRDVVRKVGERGYSTVNVDATVVMERPKLRPYVDLIRESVASILDIDIDAVSIKATTSERLGFVGREEGPAVYAVALLAANHTS